jgi:nucleoid-associated protein YgaU
MAANSRISSKTKSKGAKKPVQKKSGSKPAGKTVKKSAPSKKKPAPKKPAKPGLKSIVKPAVKPATIKAQQKPLPVEKKTVAASSAFDKKIDQMAKQSSAPGMSSGGKSFLKVFVGILIIIVAAVLVYLFYPKGKSAEVKENIATKTAVPEKEIKLPEPKPEPKKEVVKPKAVDGDIYIVKYKDQLTEISKRQYGNFIEWKRIYEANKDKIKNPHLIFPGQELVIPKKK